MPTTTLSSAAAENSTSLSVASGSAFTVNDWFSIFDNTTAGRELAMTPTAENIVTKVLLSDLTCKLILRFTSGTTLGHGE